MAKKAITNRNINRGKEPKKVVTREVSVEDVDESTDAVTPIIVIKKPMSKPLPDYEPEPVFSSKAGYRQAFVSHSLEGTLNQHVRSNYL